MLLGKNIVIIGGTTGIGLSAALAFIELGANVVAIGRNAESCALAKEQFGIQGMTLSCDARDATAAPQAIAECQKRWGDLHGLYHVAGGSGRKFGDGPLHDLTLEGWRATLDLNLTSVMLSNRAAVQTFLTQGHGGVILNMGSVLGHYPSPVHFSTHAYAAAKAAIVGFSKSTAAYYAKDDIRVNVIAPALVETPMAKRAAEDPAISEFIKTKQPLGGGRIGWPTDLDGAASLLLSDQASFITGQVLNIDGGWSISEGQI
ncbi:MAG: SDR family oxidoreductase [Saprospiraceae bacterium]|nr:SDR family oxidoreductase [Saprospiraceae bacterium]